MRSVPMSGIGHRDISLSSPRGGVHVGKHRVQSVQVYTAVPWRVTPGSALPVTTLPSSNSSLHPAVAKLRHAVSRAPISRSRWLFTELADAVPPAGTVDTSGR